MYFLEKGVKAPKAKKKKSKIKYQKSGRGLEKGNERGKRKVLPSLGLPRTLFLVYDSSSVEPQREKCSRLLNARVYCLSKDLPVKEPINSQPLQLMRI